MFNLDFNFILNKIVLIPVISGSIGWITNFIAIKMLFRPRNKFFGIQGIIPKRHKELSKSIGGSIENELLSHDDIKYMIDNIDVDGDLLSLIKNKLNTSLDKYTSKIPMIKAILPSKAIQEITNYILKEFKDIIPDAKNIFIKKIAEEHDIADIISKKIESFSLGRLEEMVFNLAKKELRVIEILGGVLGFIIGIIQVALFY